MSLMPIFLAAGNRMKKVMWDTRGSHADLAALHRKGENGRDTHTHTGTSGYAPLPTNTRPIPPSCFPFQLEKKKISCFFGSFFVRVQRGVTEKKMKGNKNKMIGRRRI